MIEGNYEEAIMYFQKEKDLIKEISGVDDPGYAKALNNLSVIYQLQGKYKEAEKILIETLKIKRNQKEIDYLSLGKTLNNLGQLYQEQGKYESAEPLYLEALQLKRKYESNNSESIGITLLNIGILYKNLGNFNQALIYLTESVSLLEHSVGKINANTSKAYFNLAMTYIALGRQNEAEPYMINNMEYIEKNAGTNHPDYASILYNMATLKWTMGNLTDAKKLFIQALNLIETKFGNSHPLYSSCLNSLGVISWLQNDYSSAKEYLKNAIYLRKMVIGEFHPDYATAVHNFAGLMKDMGNYTEAEQNYRLAFELYLKQIKAYFSFLSDKEKSDFYETLRERFEMFNCYVITRYEYNPELLCDMYDYQLATKALLMNASKKVRKKIMESNDYELKKIYDSWIEIKEDLVRYYNLSRSEITRLGINVDSLEKVANFYEKQLSQRSSAFSDEYSQTKISWKDIQKSIKKNEAAIEIIRFTFFDREWKDKVFYAALILTSETTLNPELVLLENGKELEEKYLKNYKNSINFKLTDNDSYRAFWEKIDSKLVGKKNIYLSPDGIYNIININSLRKADGTYVIDDKYISITTNTSDIVSSISNEKIKKPIFDAIENAYLFGNPSYNQHENKLSETKPSIKIPELPGTKIEIEKISEILEKEGMKVYKFTEEKATENQMKSVIKPGLIHIASHGYFLSDINPKERQKAFGVEIEKAIENPLLRSGILFSGASNSITSKPEINDSSENGILYAYEAMNLDFDKVQLIVLSACETGLGEIKNGEGVYGLQRAFQVAGAKKILMSLWKIDDYTAQKQMIIFYTNLKQGIDITEALRNAQLKLKEEYEHPYYWSPFVLINK